MTIRNLPAMPEGRPSASLTCDLSPKALQRWNPDIRAALEDDDNTISIYDPIGADMFGEGVTAKRISAALRKIGERDVVVNINSPGGDVFEAMAIYNLFREHKGRVTMKVMGLAASAASDIAMAGDEIQIGRAAFFMVHNTWVMAMGNRHDLREVADWLEPFDNTLADVYASRTGIALDKIKSALDDETWIGGAEAVEQGWADRLLDSDEVEESDNHRNDANAAARKMDVALAKAGISRSERRALMRAIKSDTPSAIDSGKPSAADVEAETAKAFAEFKQKLSAISFNPEYEHD
tara:strand:+ start:3614 stop:4495 length:882 start_codon:yes stop_codon:yes gene_type:complete